MALMAMGGAEAGAAATTAALPAATVGASAATMAPFAGSALSAVAPATMLPGAITPTLGAAAPALTGGGIAPLSIAPGALSGAMGGLGLSPELLASINPAYSLSAAMNSIPTAAPSLADVLKGVAGSPFGQGMMTGAGQAAVGKAFGGGQPPPLPHVSPSPPANAGPSMRPPAGTGGLKVDTKLPAPIGGMPPGMMDPRILKLLLGLR